MKTTLVLQNLRASGVCALAIVLLFAVVVPVAPAQLQPIHAFKGGLDGAFPVGELLLQRKTLGDLIFGTTEAGGQHNWGTLFLIVGRKEKTLHSFGANSNTDGISPIGRLVQDLEGNIYGTTYGGGTSCNCSEGCTVHNCGTVWKWESTTGKETILHGFQGGRDDGGNPLGGLYQDEDGNLYGTTSAGSSGDCGIVFKVNPKTGKETVLHRFGVHQGDGCSPGGGALIESEGFLYGTTYAGGAQGEGTIFKVSRRTGATKVVYDFPSRRGGDGYYPYGGLTLHKGIFYGTTSRGGSSHMGTLFQFDGTTETILYNFTGGTDGSSPQGNLTLDDAGTVIWGTTPGGYNGYGTVFKFALGTNSFLTVWQFQNQDDGSDPMTGLTFGDSRTMYGTAYLGGAHGLGAVFKVRTK
jgi:uncharacterized repeat protein (TIGR03803 family)